MSKLEINKGPVESPSRREFFKLLGGVVSASIMGVQKATADVLDIETNEAARRDIILALKPMYFGTEKNFGKYGYNTVQILRSTLFSIGEVRLDFLVKNINALGVEEFNFFKGETSEEKANNILDAIKQYKATLPQEVQEVRQEQEGLNGEFETKIRDSLAPVLQRFANRVQGPLNSTDSEGEVHYYHGKPKSVPNPYDDKHFFGTNVGKNIGGTYINSHLQKFINNRGIPESYEAGKITILTSKIGGKNFLAVYDIDGNIKILTYVSIGTDEDPTSLPPVITKSVGESGLIQMDKISVQAKGSSMWGGVHIRGGIYYHSSALGIDGYPKSHGCIRTPLLYLNGLHEIIKSAPYGTQIDMRFENLYS